MPDDIVWYYARGDNEQGPISTAQIKSLAATGALRRDDLVWKEGMENWLPARDVGELFPGERTRKEAGKAEVGGKRDATAASPPAAALSSTNDELNWPQILKSVGRALVVMGVLVVVMSRGCDSLGLRKVARLKALADARADSELQAAALTAESQNQMWGYWRHLGFLFGTLALAVGLLSVTATTEGPECWICLAMLAVVLYSIYSSNSVWDGSF